MIQKPFLLFCLIVFTLPGIAQNITEAQLVGKWKLSAATFEGIYMDLSSPENLKASLYSSIQKLAPGKELTADDSARVEESAVAMKQQFSKLHLEFEKGNRCSGMLVMDGENDTFTGTYSIKKNVLVINENGQQKVEKSKIKMPDKDTFIMTMNTDEGKGELVFSRR
jgi:hypothetical protein